MPPITVVTTFQVEILRRVQMLPRYTDWASGGCRGCLLSLSPTSFNFMAVALWEFEHVVVIPKVLLPRLG